MVRCCVADNAKLDIDGVTVSVPAQLVAIVKLAGNPRPIRAHLAAKILVQNGPTLNNRL